MTSMLVQSRIPADELAGDPCRVIGPTSSGNALEVLGQTPTEGALWTSATEKSTQEWVLRGVLMVIALWTGFLSYFIYSIVGGTFA